jgi:hypothetical protein
MVVYVECITLSSQTIYIYMDHNLIGMNVCVTYMHPQQKGMSMCTFFFSWDLMHEIHGGAAICLSQENIVQGSILQGSILQGSILQGSVLQGSILQGSIERGDVSK